MSLAIRKTSARQAPGARDRAACVGVLLLLGDGADCVEAEGVVLLVVGAGDRDGFGVDPGVEPEACARGTPWRASGRQCGWHTCGGRRAA